MASMDSHRDLHGISVREAMIGAGFQWAGTTRRAWWAALRAGVRDDGVALERSVVPPVEVADAADSTCGKAGNLQVGNTL